MHQRDTIGQMASGVAGIIGGWVVYRDLISGEGGRMNLASN